MSIGSRIKERREQLNLTQPELAALLGVSKGTVGNYESNVSSPNEKILFKLFEVLNCDANFLYQDNMIQSNQNLNSEELEHIKKYRALDEHGKEMVDFVLSKEYERINNQTTVIFRAAKSEDNHPPEIIETTTDFSKIPPTEKQL